MLEEIVEPLLSWYQENKRELPGEQIPPPIMYGYRRSCSSRPGWKL